MKKLLLLLIVVFFSSISSATEIPDAFVEVREVIPDLVMDIRYFGNHNFVGAKVRGYEAAKCYLTRQAANALKGVQDDLRPFGLSLKIYDCYRPQRAVNHFVEWARDIDDIKTKKEFYPNVDKRNLFKEGYIAEKSGHSRGSTVDLTIVPINPPAQPEFILGKTPQVECYKDRTERYADNTIDMGTGFDCFHPLSHTTNPAIKLEQRINRLLLKTLMEKHGFKNLAEEWWHYTLKNEPFADTYFDFEIK